MLKNLLLLRGVQVVRKTVGNTMGEPSTISTTTTLARAAIWSTSQNQRYISDKMARASSHLLVTLPDDYTFTNDDAEVLYGNRTYRITSPSEDVMNRGEMTITGLEMIS